jgi:glycosyltransferase involved in cell wall biosynthesis
VHSAVAACGAQRRKSWPEVIVVDGGSKDSTLKIAKAFPVKVSSTDLGTTGSQWGSSGRWIVLNQVAYGDSKAAWRLARLDSVSRHLHL